MVFFVTRIVDSIQECCHCSEPSVSSISVNLVNDLLTTVDALIQGEGLSEEVIISIHKQYSETEGT